MKERKTLEYSKLPYLLNRELASTYLGIDPKSFDKFIRDNDDLKRFMIGRQERYTIKDLNNFISRHSI
ncbi:DNA-binding protein [Lactococcus petauri]|uniref:DNA-binding protein n=1 Tax=Lactococcus petauri TaxID=1940789 RepID=UPI0020BDDC9F|nr:DNA-binding protein [Lactococcus petauri]UQU61200.1 hypothetical protein lgb_02003 [Lactococcus petauri]WJE12800.1 DNA-binding protein [Lactococcus petauri]